VQAGGAEKMKAGIIYQQDDYGKDGYAGWTQAAKEHGVALVSEQAIKPGQKDFTAVIADLKGKGATHIFLAVLPSATGPVLGTAAQMKFMPNWIGATPSWIDAFFAHPKLPAPVFTNFYWASSVPYWGEDIPGMKSFLASFKAHGGDARPDFYLLMSYIQGRISLEAAKRAIEGGDVTRSGYLKALQTVKNWDGGGLIQPVDLSAFPYVVGTKARVLKPDFTKKSWGTVGDYAAPLAAKK
jgi:ABC-type branched-subunit amino acid transport system substrate-binding protein